MSTSGGVMGSVGAEMPGAPPGAFSEGTKQEGRAGSHSPAAPTQVAWENPGSCAGRRPPRSFEMERKPPCLHAGLRPCRGGLSKVGLRGLRDTQTLSGWFLVVQPTRKVRSSEGR